MSAHNGDQSLLELGLIQALEDVVHSGDYGDLWWERKNHHACLVMGDGDRDEAEGYTPFDQIRMKLCKAGAKKAYIFAESDPEPEWDEEWVLLGKIGKGLHSSQEEDHSS